MRFKLVIRSIVAMVSTILLGACAEEMELEISRPEGARLIELSGKIDQEYVTRADDAGFAYGDRMGIFIVDYEGASAGKLDMDNNRASNVAFTYDGESGKWKASQAVYWKDEFTPIDVYGYYPFDNSMLSATEHSFTVEADQSQEGGDGSLSGYEKSDFLWAKQTKMSPTGEPIILNYSHRMAGVKVTLEPGNGFVGEEWGKTEKVVAVDNIKRTGVINLSTGSVTPAGSLDKSIITSPQGADIYRAVVVPQQSTAGASLISITIEGESYSYTPSEAVTFRQGKITVFTLKIDKREGGKYAVALVAQGIENWENDRSSHNYEAAAYTIIDCPKEGELGNRIAAMGKEASTIRNLKVTGRMNGADFTFIREHIPNLMALNIAEVVCVYENGYRNDYLEETLYEHVLPDEALRDMASLSHLILPKELVVLGPFSLENIGLAYYSTLIIPSTVKVLELCCMAGIEQGNLILPEGLVYIGGSAMFCNQCKWEYNLGNTVKFIGDSAFTCYYGSASHCIGNFKLPENLEYLGGNAFQGFGENLTGNVTIPTTLNEIPFGAFQGMHFAKGTDVVFHSNIVSIEGLAFAGITFNKTIIWAENLLAIGSSAFEGCVFNGGISQIPDGVNRIGSNAFGRCRRLPKKIQMPANLSKISAETFYGSDMTDIILQTDVELIENDAFAYSNVESVTIGKFVDYIGDKAFSSCQQLRSIVCLAPEPPEMGADVFEWCDYDHLILEVPEASVQKYKNAEGWNKIKYITAHHELALSISQINCLNKGVKREVLVRSEGAWSLAECPDWCRVSQTSSNIHTTEITVTITL